MHYSVHLCMHAYVCQLDNHPHAFLCLLDNHPHAFLCLLDNHTHPCWTITHTVGVDVYSPCGRVIWSLGQRSEAVQAFSRLASYLATRTNSPKSKVVCSLYGRLNLTLVRANARALLLRCGCSLQEGDISSS